MKSKGSAKPAAKNGPAAVLKTVHGQTTTPYHLAEGALGEIGPLAAPVLGSGRAFVITDSNVGPLYGKRVAEQLGAPLLELPAGEEYKRWESAERAARWLIGMGVERGDVVVAVGGGVITDLAGFTAAVTLRGLAWIAVPTTLLGMVDAAVGGKTSIDLDIGKNLIGSFWPPALIVGDPLVLGTLDHRQIRAGLAEVVKAAMIAPTTLRHLIDANLGPVASGDILRARDLIAAAVGVKAEIVALDERESGPRAALNLGHTLAHALEAATSYTRFLHGEAVTWGLLAELRIAQERGLLATSEAQAWAVRLEALAPLPALDDITWDTLAPFVIRDKKRRGGVVEWVLPSLGGVEMGATVSGPEASDVFRRLSSLSPSGPFTALF